MTTPFEHGGDDIESFGPSNDEPMHQACRQIDAIMLRLRPGIIKHGLIEVGGRRSA